MFDIKEELKKHRAGGRDWPLPSGRTDWLCQRKTGNGLFV